MSVGPDVLIQKAVPRRPYPPPRTRRACDTGIVELGLDIAKTDKRRIVGNMQVATGDCGDGAHRIRRSAYHLYQVRYDPARLIDSRETVSAVPQKGL